MGFGLVVCGGSCVRRRGLSYFAGQVDFCGYRRFKIAFLSEFRMLAIWPLWRCVLWRAWA